MTREDKPVTEQQRDNFFRALGGRDDWTPEQKAAFWEEYDDTDVSLATELGAV